MAAVAQRHDESPGTPRPPVGVFEHRTRAEVDLDRIARLEVQTHGRRCGLLLANLLHHAAHRGVMPLVAKLSLECSVNGRALDAGVYPGRHLLAPGLDAGNGFG